MNKYRISWEVIRRGTHDRRALFSNVCGTSDVEAPSKGAARDLYRSTHQTYPKAGCDSWVKIVAIEKL